jgi:hypothetical protein
MDVESGRCVRSIFRFLALFPAFSRKYSCGVQERPGVARLDWSQQSNASASRGLVTRETAKASDGKLTARTVFGERSRNHTSIFSEASCRIPTGFSALVRGKKR